MTAWSPAALYLALETSGALGSVAVSHGPVVLARELLGRQGAHAAELTPSVARVLESAGVDRRDLHGILVGGGPGSFTGVRVAAATAKGLAAALGLRVWRASSLVSAAVAHEALSGLEAGPWSSAGTATRPPSSPGVVRYVLFDARGDRVYGACYSVTDRITQLQAPHASTIREVLDAGPPPGSRFVGDGAARHHETLRSAGYEVGSAPEGVPSADGVIWTLARGFEDESVDDLARWEPDYLRGSSAVPTGG